MKKLLILAVVAMTTAATAGCRCGPLRLWWQCIHADQCVETCDPCGSACTSSPCGSACMSGPYESGPITSGPYIDGGTYVTPPPSTVPGTIIPGPIGP